MVVSAAGNSNVDTTKFIPGGCSSVLSVAAIDRENKRASFSNYGNKVDVAAPGVDIYSTYPLTQGGYKKLSGTSMAAPHISGLVSLIESIHPGYTQTEMKTLLKQHPLRVMTTSDKPIAAGVNVAALFETLLSPSSLPSQVTQETASIPPVLENLLPNIQYTQEAEAIL